MDSFFTRYRNAAILAVALFLQILGLAIQVRRASDAGSSRLLRLWAVSALTPIEKVVVNTNRWALAAWSNYFYLRSVRGENQVLHRQIEQMRIEQARLAEDANQARRLQVLFDFREKFISRTVAAQVIGSSGSEQSRVIYLDKGTRDGLRADMPVITSDGVVGKVIRIYPSSAQVLEITDQFSGVGAVLEKTRVQGIVKGTSSGEIMLSYVTSDEKIEPGEQVLTSGGDRIFPKGLPVGRVVQVSPGSELFYNIRLKPAAKLNRLEEVLVITEVRGTEGETTEASTPVRASDILAERLPKFTRKPPELQPPKSASIAAGQNPAATSASAQRPPQSGMAAKPQPKALVVPKKQVSTVSSTPAEAAPSSTAVPPQPEPQRKAIDLPATQATNPPIEAPKETPR